MIPSTNEQARSGVLPWSFRSTILTALVCWFVSFSGSAAAANVPFSQIIVDVSSPNNPWAKAVADINGDGKPDILVAGADGPLVWYQAPSSGSTWSAEITIASGGYHTDSGMAVGDIDGDGDIDVTVGTVWFENPRPSGNPASSPWIRHTLGSTGNHDVAIGDLDNDGKPDIVTRGETSSVVTVFKQNSPTSWSSRTLDPGIGLNGLALGDLDNDGDLDIIVGGKWLENPGGAILTGTWAQHVFASWDPYAFIETGDINGDGRIDIVLSVSEDSGRLSWFQNPTNPTSTWTEHVIDSGPLTKVHSLALVDIDKDGKRDVVASEYEGTGRLLVYYNDGQGLNWATQTVGTPSLHNIRVADIGGDGDYDIVGVRAFGANPVELWENRVTGQAGLPKILVFSKTAGFRHANIPQGIAAIQQMGASNSFLVDATEDAAQFTTANLAQYKAVIFLSTTGDVLNTNQENAFTAFIRNGGGFAGVHSAVDTEYSWPWYGDLIGAYFSSHPSIQSARIRVETATHPSTQGLPNPWTRSDEWFNFDRNPRSIGATILLTVDEMSYTGGTMGSDHPIAWYHAYDGGRAWYTSGGGTDTCYGEPLFLQHLLGGIKYVAGIAPPGGGDITPPAAPTNLRVTSLPN